MESPLTIRHGQNDQRLAWRGTKPIRHRRSIRLKGFDYGQDGMYFVTICTWNKEHLFGQFRDGEMELSASGEIVQAVWDDLPNHHAGLL